MSKSDVSSYVVNLAVVKDYILVGNLGYAYELDEDYLNAKKWYEYMLKMDDPKAVEYGKNGLKYIEGKY